MLVRSSAHLALLVQCCRCGIAWISEFLRIHDNSKEIILMVSMMAMYTREECLNKSSKDEYAWRARRVDSLTIDPSSKVYLPAFIVDKNR